MMERVLLKPNRKYRHIYAILRWDATATEDAPVDLRVAVTKVVDDPHFAQAEVVRLNDLNKDKGVYYFYQVTRFEGTPVEVEAVHMPVSMTASAQEAMQI